LNDKQKTLVNAKVKGHGRAYIVAVSTSGPGFRRKFEERGCLEEGRYVREQRRRGETRLDGGKRNGWTDGCEDRSRRDTAWSVFGYEYEQDVRE